MFSKLNVEYKGVKIKNAATKVGSLFGEQGREIGKKIDKITEKVTIKIEK